MNQATPTGPQAQEAAIRELLVSPYSVAAILAPLFDDVGEYLSERSDVDDGIPNEENKLLTVLNHAKGELQKLFREKLAPLWCCKTGESEGVLVCAGCERASSATPARVVSDAQDILIDDVPLSELQYGKAYFATVELPDNIRVPLDEVWADAEYLITRVQEDSSFRPAAVESIKRRIDAAKLAIKIELHTAALSTLQSGAEGKGGETK